MTDYSYMCDRPSQFCVEQGGTIQYFATLSKVNPADPSGDMIPVTLADLDSLTLRLTNQVDGAIINDRDEVDILNTNGGTFHATSGELSMLFTADDNPIVVPEDSLRRETHVAMFEARWGGGNGSKRWPVILNVDNLDNLAGVAAEE